MAVETAVTRTATDVVVEALEYLDLFFSHKLTPEPEHQYHPYDDY